MEQQFILRLPENLQTADLSTARLTKLNNKEVQLTLDGTTYKGVICKLPTIVETHQLTDNKLFKTTDISTLVVILPNSGHVTQEEMTDTIEEIEKSGLTPPMHKIRERRLKPAGGRAEVYEKVEQTVNELLKEDARAMSVEVLEGDGSVETDLDMFAAAIESELPVGKIDGDMSDGVGNGDASDGVSDTVGHIGTATPTLRTTQTITPATPLQHSVRNRQENIESEIKQPGIAKVKEEQREGLKIKEETSIKTPIQKEKEVVVSMPLESVAQERSGGINNQELEAIEGKIKERKEILEKTVNPILKKRFGQMLEQLEKEREDILKKLRK